MDKQRVTVVIPAYRCASVIGRAIDSLLAQTRVPEEIIVVDDGSPDDVAAALAPYGDRVKLIRQANGGASSARNTGIDAATGDFIAFLDADDTWFPKKLESQLAVFEKHPEVGVVSGRYRVRTFSGGEIEYPNMPDATWDTVLTARGPKAFELAMLIWTSVLIFRREVIGEDRFDVNLKIAEDRDLWVRLVARTSVYLQSDLLATYYEHDDSLSHASVDFDCTCMLKMLRKHESLLGASGLRRWEAMVYRRWAATYLGKGSGARALRPAFRRLRYQPLSPEGWWVLAKSSFLALGHRKKAAAVAETAS